MNKAMTLNEYQDLADTFAVYGDDAYPFVALAEEAGEVAGLIAKEMRGDDMVARYGSIEGYHEAMMKELGDVLWQVSQCCSVMGISFDMIAHMNIQKLTDRKVRGVIKGSGDDR